MLKNIFFCLGEIPKNTYLYLLILLLLLPSLLVNLGMEPIIDDEGIRGLVSYEMGLKHDIITPTIGGEYYFNKPPLYNWMLLSFFNWFGSASDFIVRLPTVVFLLLFAITIFFVGRKVSGTRFGFLNALAFITCGRLLFYDSYKGLIDTSFAWLIYMSFIIIYFYSLKEKYARLFIYSYVLIALAFLMKGLPAVIFQAITLIVWFTHKKIFRKLLSWQHVIGILIFVIMTGSYYFIYYQHHPELLSTLLSTILNESTKKTVVGMGLMPGIVHVFTFPVEFFYHFFPWTFFFIFLFQKGALKKLMNNSFYKFSIIVFVFNILVYWISPDTFPRYLFMFLPLVYAPLISLYLDNEKENSVLNRYVFGFFVSLTMVVVFGSILGPVLEITRHVNYSVLKGGLLLVASILSFYGLFKIKTHRMEIMILVMLITRIGFDWFIIPSRYVTSYSEQIGKEVDIASKLSKNENLYYNQTAPGFKTPVLFHLTVERNRICLFDTTYNKKGLYVITNEDMIKGHNYTKLACIHARENEPVYYLVKFND